MNAEQYWADWRAKQKARQAYLQALIEADALNEAWDKSMANRCAIAPTNPIRRYAAKRADLPMINQNAGYKAWLMEAVR